MGALSQRWDRQPPHYVNVDWNDPINRDLMFCTGFPGGAPLNAAVGAFKHGAANGGAGTSLIAEGVAFRGGANKYYSISGSVSVTSATFLAWFVKVTQKDDACLIGSPRGTNSLGLITPALSGNSRVGYMWNGLYWNFDPGSTLNIPTGELVLMAVSVIPTAATLYLGSSGSVKSVTNTNTHASQTVNALVIGADTYAASTRYADGFIPQARFWKRALSSDEIQRIYQTRWRGFAQQPRRFFLPEQASTGNTTISLALTSLGFTRYSAQLALATSLSAQQLQYTENAVQPKVAVGLSAPTLNQDGTTHNTSVSTATTSAQLSWSAQALSFFQATLVQLSAATLRFTSYAIEATGAVAAAATSRYYTLRRFLGRR